MVKEKKGKGHKKAGSHEGRARSIDKSGEATQQRDETELYNPIGRKGGQSQGDESTNQPDQEQPETGGSFAGWGSGVGDGGEKENK